MREAVLKLAATTPVDAVVIDIKGDRGFVSFRSGVALASEIGAQKIITVSEMPALPHRLHKEEIYTIGRIVTFKDNALGTAKPKLAVHRNGVVFKDPDGTHLGGSVSRGCAECCGGSGKDARTMRLRALFMLMRPDDRRERWHPMPARYDTDPNPPFRIGLPRRSPTKGEMHEVHRNHGTRGIFRD